MIAIIKYNGGNTRSVQNAASRLGFDSIITEDIDEILNADKVIFPGVGEASSAMASLERNGLVNTIPKLQQPVLGICLGMQLMCSYCEEGNTRGLGIFQIECDRFKTNLRVPHMGWNSILDLHGSLFNDINESADVYFVHSYKVPMNEFTVATCNYGEKFSAALKKGNFYATQFHPEKSGGTGSTILKNFLDL